MKILVIASLNGPVMACVLSHVPMPAKNHDRRSHARTTLVPTHLLHTHNEIQDIICLRMCLIWDAHRIMQGQVCSYVTVNCGFPHCIEEMEDKSNSFGGVFLSSCIVACSMCCTASRMFQGEVGDVESKARMGEILQRTDGVQGEGEISREQRQVADKIAYPVTSSLYIMGSRLFRRMRWFSHRTQAPGFSSF